MTSDNHSCCATDPAANSAECGAPQIGGHIAELVEFGESLTASSAGQPPRRQITWGSFTRVMLGVATGMILLFISFPYWSGPILGGVKTIGSCCAPPGSPARSERQAATGGDDCCAPPGGAASLASAPKPDGQQPIVLELDALACGDCATSVPHALSRVPGVGQVQVSFRMEVHPKPGARLSADALVEAVEKAGYLARAVQQPSGPATDAAKPVPGQADGPSSGKAAEASGLDPARNAVFKVQGLECPAVRSLGCGHLLAPELAALDKLEGVERSLANRTGTMIRVTVAAAADREKVAEGVRKILTGEDRKAVPLAGIELKRALEREEWRGKDRIGELSAIEFRTLALHRVKTFAKAEKLGQEATDKLVTIAEQQWERISTEARNEGATQPEEWANRCRKSLPVLLERVKDVLTAEQVERFKQTLTGQCRDEDRPEAPPAGTKREKIR